MMMSAVSPQVTGSVPGKTGGEYDTLGPFGVNSANLGAILFYNDSSALAPTGLTLNGVNCSLTVSTYYGA